MRFFESGVSLLGVLNFVGGAVGGESWDSGYIWGCISEVVAEVVRDLDGVVDIKEEIEELTKE